jgi:hypothetical protein
VSGLFALGLAIATIAPAAQGSAAAGGADIGSAPELPLGQTVSGGAAKDARGNYQEYWRVTASAGDALTLAVTSQSANGVSVCLYSPVVTDASLNEADCHSSGVVAGQASGTVTLDLNAAGRWTVALHGTDLARPFAYTATATIAHGAVTRSPTRTVVTAKRRAHVGASVAVVGYVKPFVTGSVRVQERRAPAKAWKTLSRRALTANGTFSYSIRFARTGTYTIRVVFGGDATHLPSAAAIVVRVTG